MKISILLPYKENFSANQAGAVSLFVNDITKSSIYQKTTKTNKRTSQKSDRRKGNRAATNEIKYKE